jgi:hypothetical protein
MLLLVFGRLKPWFRYATAFGRRYSTNYTSYNHPRFLNDRYRATPSASMSPRAKG